MPSNRKHKTAVQCRNDCNDRVAVTKTVFEWFHIVFVSVAIVVFVFSFVYGISEVSVVSSDNEKISLYVLISKYGYSLKNGDNIVVSCENENYSAIVLAQSGQCIVADKTKDEIILDGKSIDEKVYPSAEDFEKSFGTILTLPDNCVMVGYNDEKSNNFEIITVERIIGKAKVVVYPFEYRGESPDDVKR